MASLNKVTLIGNLGADPEIKQTNNGQHVANLRIATSETYTDRNGQRQENTEWHNVSAFGKTAEICGQYLSKGRSVYVEGRIKTREYTDRDGNNRKATEIVANQVLFLNGGESRPQQSANTYQQPRQQNNGGGNSWGGNNNGGDWHKIPQNNGGGSGGWGNTSNGGNDPIPF